MGITKRLTQTKHRAEGQRGLGLAETLVAVAILGIAAVAFVTALSAGSIAVGEQSDEVVAQGLVQTQLESTKSYPYDSQATTYPAVDAPAGYTISVGVAPVPGTDADIQKITVTVSREGLSLLTVADYKMNR
jgi:prepilin-type N-terminal cleavage/methylation domain-containing protein